MSGLVLKGVFKSFEDTLVLDNISFELASGELLVLLGPSGCGKTTLLRVVAGLEEADTGEIYIGNHRVERLRPRDRNVALVFQNYSLYPHMSVEKNLAFPLKVSGLSRAEIRQRVTKTAAMLGLGDRLNDKPGQLSGGQRQRVALGRAIIREPSIFLLDEPLSNLDMELRVRMRQEIVRIQKELGRTMVHVTHDQSEALTMADRIALMNNGHIEQIGTPEELYKRPVSRFVAEFVGQPTINLLKGRIEDGRLIPFGFELPASLVKAGFTQLLVGLRPEAIELCGDGPFLGRVVSCEYMGDHYTAIISFKEHSLTVSNVNSPLNPGQAVRFTFDPKALLFFDATTGSRLTPHP